MLCACRFIAVLFLNFTTLRRDNSIIEAVNKCVQEERERSM